MENKKYISLEQCCSIYSIETSFVQGLNEYGLIELTQTEEYFAIPFEQLSDLEKFMHLHYDLEINMAGLEAINHLLSRVESLQSEIISLRNQLLE